MMNAILSRSKEETILMLLGGLSIVSILPFGIIRLMQGNWALAIIDLAIVIGILGIMIFVWITRKVRVASILVTIFYSVGMLAAIHIKGQALVYWVYPTMIAAFFMLHAKEALCINTVSVSALVFILMNKIPALDLSSVVITLVLINLFSYIFSTRTSLQHSELNHQAEIDFLTGAGNRRAFDQKMTELLKPNDTPPDICLLIFDLDHFKRVNDQFGHVAGDGVLVQFCELLRSRIRAVDCLYRYGGEEFVFFAMGANLAAASHLAEELRALIANKLRASDSTITVSIGVAKQHLGESAKTWFERADAALYEAKQSGRNAVRAAP